MAYLSFMFLLATIVIILAIDVVLGLFFIRFESFTQFFSDQWVGLINTLTTGVILYGLADEHTRLRKGSHMIALLLGAKKISIYTKDEKEKILLNIVKEMSLASQIPMPKVYLLKDESINSLVNAYDKNDMLICVTKGALKHLKRDELSGMIAHGFSQVFNGNIRLSMLISSLIFGLTSLATIGSRFRSDDYYNMPFSTHIGAILFFFGSLGLIVGSVIKTAISKQSYILADANAAKFASSTSGLVGALKKILHYNSHLSSPNASLYNHFYFANGDDSIFSSLFASHPPIKERILALEPDWDGRVKNYSKQTNIKQTKDGLNELLTASNLPNIAQNAINEHVLSLAQEPFASQALILAMLATDHNEVSSAQLANLLKQNPKLHLQTTKSLELLLEYTQDYFNLLIACNSSLKNSDKNTYLQFRELVYDWIYENEKVSYNEWLTEHIIIKDLDGYFKLSKKPEVLSGKIDFAKNEVEFLLSFLSCIEEPQESQEFFEKIIKKSKLKDYFYVKNITNRYDKLSEVVKKLQQLSPQTKDELVRFCQAYFKKEQNKQLIFIIKKYIF